MSTAYVCQKHKLHPHGVISIKRILVFNSVLLVSVYIKATVMFKRITCIKFLQKYTKFLS